MRLSTPPCKPPAALLLDLLAGSGRSDPKLVSQRDWQAIGVMAGEHRLGPALHARWQDCADVPETLRRRWASDYRHSAITSLSQKRALLALVGQLEQAAIPAIALKGSWLAWHAYATPAERPMRDIDVLVPSDQAEAAWEVALDLGYVPAEDVHLPISEWARRYKHLPALENEAGILLELHVRLWDEGPYHPPQIDGLFDRAVTQDEGLRYLSPVDLLAHLAVHAVSGHHWDAGPLALLDMVQLAQTDMLDWDVVWRRAESGGWIKPAALFLAVADHWMSPGLLQRAACTIDVPDRLVQDAPALLCKPVSFREPDRAALKAMRGSLLDKLRRIGARRAHFASLRDYLGWVAAQARALLPSANDGAGASRLTTIRALDRWLKE